MANAGLKAGEVQGVITQRLAELGFSRALWSVSKKGTIDILVSGQVQRIPCHAGMGYNELRGVLERIDKFGHQKAVERDRRQIDIEDVIKDLQRKNRM
jgi:hypothetical protein